MTRFAIGMALFMAAALCQDKNDKTEKNELTSFSQSVRTLAQKVSPSVVEILVSKYGTSEEEGAKGAGYLQKQRGSGSGVVVDPNGYIVTNAHVVSSAYSVRVLAKQMGPEMSKTLEARIVGIDKESDLAVIKIEGKNLPHLVFGRSDYLQQGDLVWAFGSPLGLENSMSMGVVSSPARPVSEENPIAYIQTDAAINPGNSGGALVNAQGQLMGINSFILTQGGGSEGIGFAIPSNVVRNVYRQLRAYGTVRRGMIGVSAQSITPLLVRGLGLTVPNGVILTDVLPGSPAERAGLKEGDVVLKLDGVPVRAVRQVTMEVYRRRRGDKLQFVVLRDGKEIPASVEVAEAESEREMMDSMVSVEKNLVKRIGALLIPINQETAAKLGTEFRNPFGLLVAARSAEGINQDIDLRPGDVIFRFNGTLTTTLESIRTALDRLKSGDAVVLTIEREGQYHFVAFELN